MEISSKIRKMMEMLALVTLFVAHWSRVKDEEKRGDNGGDGGGGSGSYDSCGECSGCGGYS